MKALLILGMSFLLSGCVSAFDARLADAPSELVRDCAAWYAALDRAVDEAGVRDAQSARVAGFPYARTDRLFASLRERAGRSNAGLQAFAERLAELDLQARAHEILNLPRASVEALPGMGPTFTRDFALRRTHECARLLRELDLAKPQARSALLQRAHVSDGYSGVRRCEGHTRRGVRPQDEPAGIRYAPARTPALPRAVIAGLLERAIFDPLGQPLLSERELAAVAAVHAPSFQIPVAADYDRFGEVRWRRGGEEPEVDASRLVAYVHPAYARYRDRVLLQLVYTIWFPGRLDGITWRVTLAPDGEPLLYDAIHACGCYHHFFPTPRARLRAAPLSLDEVSFVPRRLPRVAEEERPVVMLASGTHRIEGVALVRGVDSLVRYELRSHDELRSLPRSDGGRRSFFGPERMVPGYDADLIEQRFELDLAGDAR